ncbi:GntR family transcriptional regulator [Xanthomonas campestris pv. phormiicola]|nr:GntR family transcriptional regulator [Xanthomonas campestris pv. phormiicola]
MKADIKSGAFPSGHPISAAMVSRRFSSSIIPVREALYRLAGERLIEARDHEGFYAVRISEVGLRDLYKWQYHLVLESLDQSFKPALKAAEAANINNSDPSLATIEVLFRTLADKSGNQELGVAIHNTLDRTVPVALVKDQVSDDWATEYENLLRHWQLGDVHLFKDALHSYNSRRIELVPDLVERLNHLRPSD